MQTFNSADTLDAGESILHWVNHPAFKDFGDKFNEICPGKDMTDGLHFQVKKCLASDILLFMPVSPLFNYFKKFNT